MREIIFRGKRIDNGEWVYGGSIIHFNKECGEDRNLVFMPQYSEKCICTHDENDNIVAWDETCFYKIDPDTVGQFTGLHDKNGKRIFEGDILKWDEHVWGCPYNEPVVWDYGRLSLRENDWSEFCEIIGNKWDNPELLN